MEDCNEPNWVKGTSIAMTDIGYFGQNKGRIHQDQKKGKLEEKKRIREANKGFVAIEIWKGKYHVVLKAQNKGTFARTQ